METVLVLSAGRTGTVFLTRTLPAHVGGLHVVHEPPGSRTTLVLGNLRAWSGWGGGWLRDRIAAGIDARRRDLPPGTAYVEINPMLCPAADLLPDAVGPLRLVHLVRHPVGWVRSIRAFKASGWRRHLVDHLPFVSPSPWPRPEGFSEFDQVALALWRWRVCNERIEALAPRAERYLRLTYEELFTAERPVRIAALEQLLELLDRPMPADPTPLLEASVANPAPAGGRVDVDPELAERVCGPLLRRYGYSA